ncbi:MAG: lipopolysaccharide biosynthesis protein [Bacteroidaceae bacterium]|nr:lipopolysaccharide biosynthesis protein [Bacteroidaceae bacterium]
MSVVDQKRIARNTLLLYIRMGLVMLVGLYTSRVVLDVLGEVDNGIYNAIGGVVVMFSFLSTTLSTACQRFFSFELGKDDFDGLRAVFSQSLVIFLGLVLLVVVLGETAGLWFVEHKMQMAGRNEAARWVFHCSVAGFLFLLLRTPYMGMIIARERMKVFAYISVFEALGALAVAIALQHYGSDKLKLYALLMLILQALTAAAYWLYCRLFYRECRPTLRWNGKPLMRLFRFTGWEMMGTLAGTCKTGGVSILINMFFGPLLNTPRALAQKVYMTIAQLQTYFYMAVRPQIIKSYAAGALDEMEKLLFQSTRLTYYLLLVIAVPLMVETPFILDVWLKDVPAQTVFFTRLLLVGGLIDSFGSPLGAAVQATGQNRRYQTGVGLTLLAILPATYVAYKVLHLGVEWAFYFTIFFSFVAQLVRADCVRRQTGVNMRRFVREVVVPVVVVTLIAFVLPLLLRQVLVPHTPVAEFPVLRPLLLILVSILWTSLIVWLLGITSSERRHLTAHLRRILRLPQG